MRNAYLSLTALAFAAATIAPVEALAQSSRTTRVETRPFYGATVTLEEGVRVFRPLPTHDRIIINPGAAAPLSLGFVDHRASRAQPHQPTESYIAEEAPVGATGGHFNGPWHGDRQARDRYSNPSATRGRTPSQPHRQ